MQIKKVSYSTHTKKYMLTVGIAVSIFAIIGTTLILRSQAATPAIVQEAESGTLAGNYRKLSGASAAGASDQVVLFGATTSTTPTPPPGTTPPPTGVPYIIASAGDIAQNGGEKATSDLIIGDSSIQSVLALGDNAYESGTIGEYNAKYAPTWGRFKAKTLPTPGNHEARDGGKGYYAYFSGVKPYYSLNLGSWHIISLNSDGEDHSAASAQMTWLKNDLAANTAKCTLAFWHTPRFTSGTHDDDLSVSPFWDVLYPANVDVILNGHSHTYERFAKSKPDGSVDAARGVREFVVGTGGAALGNGSGSKATREFNDSSNFGVIKMTLSPTEYSWQFLKAGGGVTDSGTQACH
jgi:hypothetical protein